MGFNSLGFGFFDDFNSSYFCCCKYFYKIKYLLLYKVSSSRFLLSELLRDSSEYSFPARASLSLFPVSVIFDVLYIVMFVDYPHKPYEEYLLEWCGLPISYPLPSVTEEYYWMILVGETPPVNLDDLPRRPLGFYLASLAGMSFDEGVDLEYYWSALTDGTVTSVLPRRPLEYYLMNYVPSGFRFRIDSYGMGILFGEDPLPNFTLNESTGVLTYSDSTLGSPSISAVSLSPTGYILLEE